MEIVLREIAITDAEEITGLSRQLGYAMPQEQMQQHIKAVLKSKDCAAFVAVYKKQAIGWIGLAYRIQLESAPFCEINGLVVHEQYRGQGIGKLLIEKAKSWSIEKKSNYLRLRANITRTEAHEFYRTLGFNEIKQQKVFEMKT